MALDPECAAILEAMKDFPPFEDMTIEESRQIVMGFVPFMGPPEDVADATDLKVDTRVALVGDSSGGNLAAAVALLARDRGGPPVSLQVLVYPATAGFDPNTASHAQYGEGHLITTKGFQMFWDLYTGGTDPGPDAYAAPLRVSDLAGVAPAMVLTAECDPMRDEGEAYADRLTDSGVPVERKRYDGMIHGFLYMPTVVTKAREAIDDVSAGLKRAFAG